MHSAVPIVNPRLLVESCLECVPHPGRIMAVVGRRHGKVAAEHRPAGRKRGRPDDAAQSLAAILQVAALPGLGGHPQLELDLGLHVPGQLAVLRPVPLVATILVDLMRVGAPGISWKSGTWVTPGSPLSNSAVHSILVEIVPAACDTPERGSGAKPPGAAMTVSKSNLRFIGRFLTLEIKPPLRRERKCVVDAGADCRPTHVT